MSTKQEFINSLELHSEVVHQKNAEIADLKRQLAEAKDPHSDEQEPTFLNQLLRQRDSLQDQLDDLKRQLAESVQRQEALEAVVALDKQQLTALREQNAKLREAVEWAIDYTGLHHSPQPKVVYEHLLKIHAALRETTESEVGDATD